MSKTTALPETKGEAYSRVLCIGSGIAGIALAVQLQKRLQCRDIHIYDRQVLQTACPMKAVIETPRSNDSPGGVWAVQKYPGKLKGVTAC